MSFTFNVTSVGSVTLTRKELLSEAAGTVGFPLNQQAAATASEVDQLANELYASGSSPRGAYLRLQVVGGVGTVLSAPRDGQREVFGRDASNAAAQSTSKGLGGSAAAQSLAIPHHADIRFTDQPNYVGAAPQSSKVLELEVGVTHAPALDSVVGVAPLVAAFGSNGSILSHSEIGSSSTTSFSTRLLVDENVTPVTLRVYDASEDPLGPSQLIGTTQAIELNTLLADGVKTLPISSNVAGIEKKLRKKNTAVTIASVKQVAGVAPQVAAAVVAAAAVATVAAAAVAVAASDADAPAAKVAPVATEAPKSSEAPIGVIVSSPQPNDAAEVEFIPPTSPQHLEEQEAIGHESAATAQELAAAHQLKTAEETFAKLKPKDSKATLEHQAAERALKEAREAHEAASKHATEARANLALKREARIAEEDRQRAEIEAARRANPNMTLWGERRRTQSVLPTELTAGGGIDQIVLSRRASQARVATVNGVANLLLAKVSVKSIRNIGAFKPIIGTYLELEGKDGSYLDHSDRQESTTEDGDVSFEKPFLLEFNASLDLSKTHVTWHLFNMSGDSATASDILCSATIDVASLANVTNENELVLPLRAHNKAVNDRLKRQDSSIIIRVQQRSQNVAGSIIPTHPPLPLTIAHVVPADETKHQVRPSIDAAAEPATAAFILEPEQAAPVATNAVKIHIASEQPAAVEAAPAAVDAAPAAVEEPVAAAAEPVAAAPAAEESVAPAAEPVAAAAAEEPVAAAAVAEEPVAASSSEVVVGPGQKQCSSCNQVKSKKDDFSAAQGKKKDGKCKACTA